MSITRFEPGELLSGLAVHTPTGHHAHHLWCVLASEGDDTYILAQMAPPKDSSGQAAWFEPWLPSATIYRVRLDQRGAGLGWDRLGVEYRPLRRTGETYEPRDPSYNSVAVLAREAHKTVVDLTVPEQVRRLGARRSALGEELRGVSRELARAAVAAVAAGHTKTEVARDARITRATLDAWIHDRG